MRSAAAGDRALMAKSRSRTGRADKIGEIPLEAVASVPVKWLVYDSNNPRFTPDKGLSGASDVDIIQELTRTADLRELIESIATNGYIDIEPLVIMRTKASGPYTVLEGNRRLAALSVL